MPLKNTLRISLLLLLTSTSYIKAQTVELLKDFTGDKKSGINNFGIESASTANVLYFQAVPSFITKIVSSTGEKGNATIMSLNDSIGDPRFLTASGTNLYFTGNGKARGLYVYSEINNTVTYLMNTTGGDDFGIFPAKNNSAFFVRSKTFGSTPDQIWFTNGTAVGTRMVYESKDFPTKINYSRLGDALIISDANTSATQKQAIISDGTTNGSVLVKTYVMSLINLDIVTDAAGSGNVLFIYGKNSSGKSSNYYITAKRGFNDLGNIGDITSVFQLGSKFIINAGQVLNAYDTVQNKLEQLTTMGSLEYSYVGTLRYFFTKNGSGKKDLWESDGTKAGTKVVNTSIGPTVLESFNAVIATSRIYYVRNIGNIVELWEYDSVNKSNKRITDLYIPLQIFFTPTLFLFKDKVFFGRETTTGGMELWYYNLVTGVKNVYTQSAAIAYYDQVNNQIVRNREYEGKKLSIQLYNSSGTLLLNVENYQDAVIPLSDQYSSGIYFVRINEEENFQALKLSLHK